MSGAARLMIAGIADEGVDVAELGRVLSNMAATGRIDDVGLDGDGAAALRADLLRHRLSGSARPA